MLSDTLQRGIIHCLPDVPYGIDPSLKVLIDVSWQVEAAAVGYGVYHVMSTLQYLASSSRRCSE